MRSRAPCSMLAGSSVDDGRMRTADDVTGALLAVPLQWIQSHSSESSLAYQRSYVAMNPMPGQSAFPGIQWMGLQQQERRSWVKVGAEGPSRSRSRVPNVECRKPKGPP
ncbi:uncharacterized protein SPPG_01105 [Spizellomyces punctatus DAOM BR117]|uniref:Uncharacterized protein n=1 Tax=Spizellomyces punctatus (strain DAOM BR117) TaxID=645134 RepID=A0A0L0HS01_SPIPD|nr:uncharacterized protein SPPG_01105 [Spizellomyces punctatus DAOM BR117]KND03629.1 hypothetical protein SPPG_01105 [Spizellomyces punctatus DAOM BR117]|eukprot:XP_016611668.1 hypothetical protein SPPG_01105 [Spizellomyces punctatus DAOM BR117]